jgi:hypothetical protein
LLEDLCTLRYKARFETLKPSELNQLRLLGNSLGLDGRERYANVHQAKKAGKLIDPRDAFEARRPRGNEPA